MNKTKSIDMIDKKYFTFAEPPLEFVLESGEKLCPVTVAYETYGELNENNSNAILVEHAFSGDSHAAGYYPGDEKPGWWDAFIGPGRALDTNKYFIICANVIGGCRGSTGPCSVDPVAKRPYALDFPLITVGDMVNAQKRLLDHLGIQKLLTVIGGSMGGMQVLQWAAAYPEKICSAIPIATTLKHSPQQIAFDEVGRQAIIADPAWLGGNYYEHGQPEKGLAIARMIGHITYMSDRSMEEKFSRKLKDKNDGFKFTAEFEVEGYLRYRGDSFVKRFDANSYLYITKAMDYFDLSNGKLIENKNIARVRFLVIAFKSDWLYPAYQSQEIARVLKNAGINTTYCEIDSTYGHDAFLVEIEKEAHLVKYFLQSVGQENGVTSAYAE